MDGGEEKRTFPFFLIRRKLREYIYVSAVLSLISLLQQLHRLPPGGSIFIFTTFRLLYSSSSQNIHIQKLLSTNLWLHSPSIFSRKPAFPQSGQQTRYLARNNKPKLLTMNFSTATALILALFAYICGAYQNAAKEYATNATSGPYHM